MMAVLPLMPEPAQEAPGDGAEGEIPCQRGWVSDSKEGPGAAVSAQARDSCADQTPGAKISRSTRVPVGLPMLPHLRTLEIEQTCHHLRILVEPPPRRLSSKKLNYLPKYNISLYQ